MENLAMSPQLQVAVLYGGRSTEREISRRSASYILKHLNREKYQVQPVFVDAQGRWHPLDYAQVAKNLQSLAPYDLTMEIDPPSYLDRGLSPWQWSSHQGGNHKTVVFPILHGAFGEDGLLQGYLELAGLPYVGSDSLGSGLAMDKVKAKALVAGAGVSVVPSLSIRSYQWLKDRSFYLQKIDEFAGRSELFVKAVCSGSSVGVYHIIQGASVGDAIDNALRFDEQVLVEKAVVGREIEFAALGGYDPEISGAGEVVTMKGFYSFKAKYEDPQAAQVLVPAPLSQDQEIEGRRLAATVFQTLGLYGMARLDFFLCADGQFFFNEANALPGFTKISQYPRLWEHQGLAPGQILDRLVETALARYKQRGTLLRSL